MHVYEHEDAAEETQYSFVLQVQKTYDKLTRIWWSCYGHSYEPFVLKRYHETKKLEPNETYRIIKVTKHITRSWEILETPYENPPNRKHEAPSPQYTIDLNAMHQAEKSLSNDQWWVFVEHLTNICGGGIALCISATALQRATALKETLS